MKEIDLLPDWIKDDRRKKIGCRTQYLALGGILLIMIVWSYVTAAGVSRANAKFIRLDKMSKAAQQEQKLYLDKGNIVSELQKKENILKDIDCRINVAPVLAELSFLINEKVVLSSVSITSEKFENNRKISQKAVKPAAGNTGKGDNLFAGDVKFRVVLKGMASDPGEVANLICLFEDSPYFNRVIPLFSENIKIQTANVSKKENMDVTQFEIACFLANYEEPGI